MSLPEWPDTATFIGLPNETQYGDQWLYESARAEAAIARLRVTVEALKKRSSHYECEDCWYSCATITCNEDRRSDECDCAARCVLEALSLIGDIPE